MSFRTFTGTINTLDANQAVTSSVTPVDITGFSFILGAGKMIAWELQGIFTLGATGGFRFLMHNTSAPTAYNNRIQIVDVTTPATFNAAQSTEAAFANASAVAGNYSINAHGFVLANAATTFSIQFAQNTSDVLSITMLRGARMLLWQMN